ncbi:MAG: Type II secretion system protein L [Gammaproteobacteria bacterium]|nr:Type II secretion system protein L [Gammaproteobacteria bacterium]
MSEAVLIRPAGIPDVWECARLAVDAAKGAARGSLEEVARLCRGQRVVALVPGTAVTLHHVQVPARSASEIRMAVPFALEEQLAGKIEGLHFAIGPKAADGMVPVAVMNGDALRAFLKPLQEAGITPDAVLPEPLALPWTDGTRSVLIDHGNAIVRTAITGGFAIEAGLLPSVLQRFGDAQAPVRLWHDPESVSAAEVAKIAAEMGKPVEQQVLPPVLAAVFAQALHSQPCNIDLLQGEYRARKGGALQRFLPAIVLALAALLVHLGWSGWDLYALKRTTADLDRRSEELFRKAFPEVKRVVNMDAQADQALAALRSGSGAGDFLDLYAQAASVLQSTPGLEIDSIMFRDGQLSLAVRPGDKAAIGQIAERIAAASGVPTTVQDDTRIVMHGGAP